MRVLIPCYGTAPAVVITDEDIVVGSNRVAHKLANGNYFRVNPDGSVGQTPGTSDVGAWETAAVANELRIFYPDINSLNGFAYRITDPGTVPNV